jgi:hypothetical protein
VAEELTFQKVLMEAGAVGHLEGLLAAVGVVVNGSGHEILARARLTVDQHADFGTGYLLDPLDQLGHGLAGADDALETEALVELLQQVAVHPRGEGLSGRPGHQLAEAIQVQGLGHAVVGLVFAVGAENLANGRLQVGGGREDDLRVRGDAFGFPEQVQAAHAPLQLIVGDDHVGGPLADGFDGLRAAGHHAAGVPLANQAFGQGLAVGLLGFND